MTWLARRGHPLRAVTPTFPLLGPLGCLPLPTKWTLALRRAHRPGRRVRPRGRRRQHPGRPPGRARCASDIQRDDGRDPGLAGGSHPVRLARDRAATRRGPGCGLACATACRCGRSELEVGPSMASYEDEFEDVLEMARALLGGNEDAPTSGRPTTSSTAPCGLRPERPGRPGFSSARSSRRSTTTPPPWPPSRWRCAGRPRLAEAHYWRAAVLADLERYARGAQAHRARLPHTSARGRLAARGPVLREGDHPRRPRPPRRGGADLRGGPERCPELDHPQGRPRAAAPRAHALDLQGHPGRPATAAVERQSWRLARPPARRWRCCRRGPPRPGGRSTGPGRGWRARRRGGPRCGSSGRRCGARSSAGTGGPSLPTRRASAPSSRAARTTTRPLRERVADRVVEQVLEQAADEVDVEAGAQLLVDVEGELQVARLDGGVVVGRAARARSWPPRPRPGRRARGPPRAPRRRADRPPG